jgi:RimJ/RimL family protein N-acetyltransferase
MISLLDVYEPPETSQARPGAVELLYGLLGERDPVANISHKRMPNLQEHQKFVRSVPYAEWWFIRTRDPGLPSMGAVHGACYLTRQNEIGIQIFKHSQGKGIAKQALTLLLERHQGERLLANISLRNEVSAKLFRSFGFRMVQYTYALEAE